MNLKPTQNKSSFIKVYGELLFFLIFTRFAYQNDFFILGVAILLLVVIALYGMYSWKTTFQLTIE